MVPEFTDGRDVVEYLNKLLGVNATQRDDTNRLVCSEYIDPSVAVAAFQRIGLPIIHDDDRDPDWEDTAYIMISQISETVWVDTRTGIGPNICWLRMYVQLNEATQPTWREDACGGEVRNSPPELTLTKQFFDAYHEIKGVVGDDLKGALGL